LARVLGAEQEIEPEVAARTLRAKELLVLCSDGLPLHLSDADIARIVSDARTPEAACNELIEVANARGGRDNLSAVVISAAPASCESATSERVPPS
jgi:protein phosphatase